MLRSVERKTSDRAVYQAVFIAASGQGKTAVTAALARLLRSGSSICS